MVVKFPPVVHHRRFTVADYHRMIELAILPENLPVELIDGEVVVKAERRSAPFRGTARIERYPFSPTEVQQLRAAGLLGPHDRIEQRNVEEWQPMSIGDPHCVCIDLLTNLLTPMITAFALVRIQNPVIFDISEPEPDVSVVRRRQDGDRKGKPQPADVHLIIEVADTSLAYDRNEKGPRYASNAIPEYWIVDLNSDTVFVHRHPQPDGAWSSITSHGRGDTLTVAALPTVTVAVDEILP